MKISILTSQLQEAIKKLNTIVQGKENISQGILFTIENNYIVLKKSNGTSQIKITLDANISENGSLFMPINTIKLIEKLKNVNYLELNDNYIQANNKKIKFIPMDIENYWNIKNVEYMYNFELSSKELTRMLSVKYACAKDDTRPILQGINIKENIFCALDGYIISLRESKEFRVNHNVTISPENIKILDKIINKKSDSKVIIFNNLESNDIYEETTHIMYTIDNIEIISRTLQGDYFNYKNIIPENHTTLIKLDTNKLFENMEFLKNIKTDNMMLTKFNIDKESNILIVNGSTIENTIEDKIECDVSGDNLLIAFNCELMLLVLKNYKDKNITMNFTSRVNPCVIRETSEYNDYNLDVVLPIRIRETMDNVA